MNFSDSFGLCPEEMRTEEREVECREYNESRIRRTLAIIEEEMARGNPYALGGGESYLTWAHDVDLQKYCVGEQGKQVVGCAFPNSGSIYVDPDRDPAAIAATIVHERVHVLFRGGRGGQGCARWQAWLFVTQMSAGNRDAAIWGDRAQSISAPWTDSQVPCR